MKSNDLIDFMESATKNMEDEYIRIQKRTLEDLGTAGDQGEENWATLLRNWLPPIFQIVTKGRILSHNGIASPQVDVLVLQPEYPKHLLDKKLYLAGGIIAAFECKTSLKSQDIDDFLENSKTIKDILTKRTGTPYKEIQSPLIFGLLAHSHTWKKENSKPLENITNKLIESDKKHISHPWQMPDILCVADLAFWSSLKFPYLGFDPNHLNLGNGILFGGPSSGYICRSTTKNQTKNFYPIGAMITGLMRKIAWEYPNLRQLAKYFEDAKIEGNGNGDMRKWTTDIYSKKVRDKVEQGFVVNVGNWDEWSMTIL